MQEGSKKPLTILSQLCYRCRFNLVLWPRVGAQSQELLHSVVKSSNLLVPTLSRRKYQAVRNIVRGFLLHTCIKLLFLLTLLIWKILKEESGVINFLSFYEKSNTFSDFTTVWSCCCLAVSGNKWFTSTTTLPRAAVQQLVLTAGPLSSSRPRPILVRLPADVISLQLLWCIIINLSNLANEWLEGNCFASANNRSNDFKVMCLFEMSTKYLLSSQYSILINVHKYFPEIVQL